MPDQTPPQAGAVIIGGGFTGLAAAMEFAKRGQPVTVIEADNSLGGLAGGFEVAGQNLEKFYHHWFASDQHIMDMIKELGKEDRIVLRPTRTGMYYAKNFFRLSSPFDVLKFTPLSLVNRIRLGMLVFQVRSVKDWRQLEGLTVKQWLTKLCGEEVYRVVWEPLMVGKFGSVADEISAVWFWKKLVLRGGSRGSKGQEILAYYTGGFAALADAAGDYIRKAGGRILMGTRATGVTVEQGRVTGVTTTAGTIPATTVLSTAPLSITADVLEGQLPADYTAKLRRIRYLANVCIVLQLDRSLSDTYWLNVNDATFPFVGIIEHTNFEPPASYAGRHIVYLSRYLQTDDPLYRMSPEEAMEYALPHVQRMFPQFNRNWIKDSHVWRAEHAQPVVERHYSSLMPPMESPLPNLFVSTMAQVYPEDRGTNYAVREGRKAADLMLRCLNVAVPT
jgi:protoporphyrinogen oxidase